MKSLSLDEIKKWIPDHGIDLNEKQTPCVRFKLPKTVSQYTWFCKVIESALQPREHCLLWIENWSIWPSSENWHLYYRLRQSYGDAGLIEETPGHLFLNYEGADLVSFLEIGLMFGWDMHALPSNGYGRIFISHDEWVEFSISDPSTLSEIEQRLIKGGVEKINTSKSQ